MSTTRVFLFPSLLLLSLLLTLLSSPVTATCYFEEWAGSFPQGAIFPTQTFSVNNGSSFDLVTPDTCLSSCSSSVVLTFAIGPLDSAYVVINGLALNTAGQFVTPTATTAYLQINQTTVNPLAPASKYFTGSYLTVQTQAGYPVYRLNYNAWKCPATTEKVTNTVAFTTFLPGVCAETEVFEVPRQCAGIKGDPVFQGFHGQQYEVHGLPGKVFNLISARSVQLNSRFIFLDEGDALNAGQQLQLQYASAIAAEQAQVQGYSRALQAIKAASTPIELPYTTAWSHPGTYLGEVGVLLRTGDSSVHNLQVTAGRYQAGFDAIQLDSKPVTPTLTSRRLLDVGNVSITLLSPSTLRVVTSEVSFLLVNSDGFLNVDEARLTPLTIADPSLLEGLIGQSADPQRFFPRFARTQAAPSAVKNDWQTHMMMDYIADEDDLFSIDFPLNKF